VLLRARTHVGLKPGHSSGGTALSPRWTTIGNAALYFYASEPHQRPHVDVIGPDWEVTIALDDLTVLAQSGRPPARVMRGVRAVLTVHQQLAIEAFHATRQHRFPGTLEQQLEAGDD
jgi:hypothetical protein